MSKSVYEELSGCESDELGNVFKAIGKGLGKVAKVGLGVAKGIPGIGTAVGVAEGGVNALAKGLKKKKKPAAKKAAPKKKAKGVTVSRPSVGVSDPSRVPTLGAPAPAAVIVAEAKPIDINKLASIFRSQLSPQLASIASQLQGHNLQAQITSEHRGRAARAAFQAKVLQSLAARR